MIFKNLCCRTIRRKVLQTAISMILFLGYTSVAMADQEIELADKFTGKIADPALADACPDSGIINELAAWKKLWAAWRPNQPIKDIDFRNQIVLVETVAGPNLVFSSLLKLDEQGDLKYEIASSRIAGPGFGYLIMVVPKTGINSVNGMTMDGTPVEAKPMAENPEKTVPQSKPENRPPQNVHPPLDPKPYVGAPGVDPSTIGLEFVKVEIVGRVRTQFRSVGAETTGTLVAADGIIWELDLQQDEQLVEAARGLGNSLARIKGNLKMVRQRGGIDARVRWIVTVESLERLGFQAAIPLATLPTKQPIAGNPQPNPIPAVSQDFDPTRTQPLKPNQSTPESILDGVADVPKQHKFTQLSIVTSDGQTQLIDPDGLVRYESKPNNLSNQWNADSATIAKLHRFVEETAWDLVPKMTRSNLNDPSEISYTISIETSRGVSRFFIDRTAVPDQPTMKQFFDIISEMARKQ